MATTELENSLNEAEMLVAYVARQGISIGKEILEGVTRTRELLTTNSLSASEETTFYNCYSQLAQKVLPVSVTSLKACLEKRKFSRLFWWPRYETPAHRAVRLHRRRAVVTLIFLLVVQIYWLIGHNLVKNLPILSEDPEEFKKAAVFYYRYEKAKLVYGEDAKNKTRDINFNRPPLIRTEQSIDAPSTSTTVQTPAPAQQASQKQQEDRLTERDFHVMEIEINRLETSAWLLRVWNIPIELLALGASYFIDFPDTANSTWRSTIPAKYILNILQAYILPMLYGWLGAVAYVLRNLIAETKNQTYQEETDFGSRLRTYLGLLSGLAIGWFVEPISESKTVIGLLSPLALAFLAGYSVELLFTAMDRILAAFTSDQPKKT
jgi:hypothetical protein